MVAWADWSLHGFTHSNFEDQWWRRFRLFNGAPCVRLSKMTTTNNVRSARIWNERKFEEEKKNQWKWQKRNEFRRVMGAGEGENRPKIHFYYNFFQLELVFIRWASWHLLHSTKHVSQAYTMCDCVNDANDIQYSPFGELRYSTDELRDNLWMKVKQLEFDEKCRK